MIRLCCYSYNFTVKNIPQMPKHIFISENNDFKLNK